MILFKQDRLPYSSRLEWIQSDGNAFIDTGLIIDNTLTGEIEFEVVESKPGVPIIGSYENPGGFCLRQSKYDSTHEYYRKLWIGTPNWWDGLQNDILGRHTFKLISLVANKRVDYLFDGENFQTRSGAVAPVIPQVFRLLLFRFGIETHDTSVVRIYRANFSTSTQSFDMIPVKICDESCMFDKISGRFFKNAGSGNFIAGPKI